MGLRRNPYAFTEQGVSMLSAVLKSSVAIQVSIAIMRAFVAMRNYITTTTTVTAELAEIRAKLALLERVDADNAEAVSDLSEDMRKELDNIYNAIAALSVKIPQARKPAPQKLDSKQAEQKGGRVATYPTNTITYEVRDGAGGKRKGINKTTFL